ncbi:hypothetical protein RLON56S_01579 [Alishewanella longhuensis]
MALCAQQDANGYLIATNAPLSECPGFVLLESGDSLPMLTQLFDPAYLSTAQYSELFWMGVSLPLLGYVTSWAFQTVISFINK